MAATHPHPLTHHAQLRNHLQALLTGGVAALSLGYYRLHHDVWDAAAAVDARLDALGAEAVATSAHLEQRVATLEAEVATLKALGLPPKPE